MAVYQAAVSKQDKNSFSSTVMEDAEVCSLPGGLASVRRQFESEVMSSAHTVTQIHHTHRSVQEVSNSSAMSVASSSGGRQVSQQVFLQDERTAHDQITHNREVISSYENNHNESEEEEYYPRLSAKELAQHFEKTIEEAAPSKKIKIERDKSRSQMPSDVSASHQTVKSEISRSLNSVSTDKAEEDKPSSVFAFDEDDDDDDDDDLEYLPPPPPDLLEEPSDDVENFPEPPAHPVKHTVNREQYCRQRELLELKRLCKHIHPDVRKELEKDFYNDEDIEAVGDVQEVAYQFEHAGSNSNGSPDREYLEWDEILRGEVQSMRWMFENKPLDSIKNDSDNEEDSKKIIQQEIIAGGDVRNTAMMFEMQPMDTVGLQHDSAKRNYLVNEVGKRDVRAAAWLFETKPMDTLNKIHTDDEQTKEVIFTQETTEGDVKSVRYMFENQEMDSLGDTETMDEKQLLSLKSVLEEIKSEVKKVIWMFETQCMCVMREQTGEMVLITSVRREETEKGDVKTSRWLFETQPLDDIDMELSQVRLISSISMEDNQLDGVKRGRWLFETKRLDSINAQWERLQQQQKDEIIGADVRKHCMVFETQPMDTLKDDANSRPVTTEQIIGGNVRSVRHLFENAQLDELKELPEVGKLNKKAVFEEGKGDVRHQKWVFENKPLEKIKDEDDEVNRLKKTIASDEERGDVRHQKWLFENQHLEDIQEEKRQFMKTIDSEQIDQSYKGDVLRNCWVFETQPMDTLKDDSNARPVSAEEIIGGDVQSARHFFETAPKDEIKELAEVGKLKRTMTSEEKGDVRHQKWLFESQPLELIGEEKKEITRTVNLEDIENVDVSNYKQIFETYDLSQYDESQKIQVEGVTTGYVRSNKDLFESMPLYALQDSSGHYHEVRTVRREEIVKGDVRSCQWMFETRPIDQFDESITKFQIIKGITQQEVESGDVKTGKWLFETQPLDAIKYFSNIEDEECVTTETAEIVKGDVKTCKWLFETKPIDMLYEREEFKSTKDSGEIQKGDVKTCTWLFETQTLDAIQDNSETVLQTHTVKQEDIHGKDVRMVRFLFETENLENIAGEEQEAFKSVTEIDIQSGDVSRMKYIFETQSSDVMSSTSEDVMRQLRSAQAEDIQKGNVGNCKWLFENQPIDAISETPSELKGARTVQDVQGGNVDKGRFIFETYSLDEIQDTSSEAEMRRLQKVIREDEEKGDVKTYAMMFETQPLYAIQDKEGHYHEVTTLTKEEIQRGDVIGARWLFETKPLDSIKETDEVYLLKAVTEEDIHKGDVSSARWRFETQPLDKIAEDAKISIKTVEDIQGGDVKTNKQRFESDAMSQKMVRTVSMSEIHKGDVRTAKWMFETHTIDQIHAEKSEDEMNTVVMEEQLKGDVKQSVWLFEKNPLDHINDSDESKQVTCEDIPKADVKTTTWLFETTPFTEFNESCLEKPEVIGKSVKATLDELYTQRMVDSKGIIIEADEIGDIRMAKYNLMNKEAPQIQREDIIKGDLQSIMINLLNRQEKTEKKIIINAEERGDISGTVQQLLQERSGTSVEKEEIIRGDIQEAINNLLKDESTGKRGILIQEDEKGDIRMTIYSLFNSHEESNIQKENIVRGNVKGCLERLCNPDTEEIARIKVDEAERGKVSFYSTCIESGALDYLKKLQVEPDEADPGKIEKEEIIGGDIKEMKLSLTRNQAQIGRLVDREDIVPGDVHNTVKVFMTEPPVSFEHLQREEIVRGDLQAAMNSLTQSVNQAVVLEKEVVVRADLPTTLRSLEEAQNQPREVEKPEIIPGNIKGALKSLKNSASTKVEIVIEDLVPGDIKGKLKSLEEAKYAVKEVEKEMIVKGDIHTAIQSLQEASNERKVYQQEIGVQGDVKGKIQLLLEPPPSPRMQRRASTEGDVKLSIKSLYDTQEQVQSEKEEVIKGDVKGTIKSLMETARRASPTIPRREPIRKAKVPVKTSSPSVKDIPAESPTPVVKNLDVSSESQRSTHKQSTQNRYASQESTTITGHTTTCNQETKTTVLEHKTIVQTHGVKTLKTDFRNLKKSGCKGLIRLDKRKQKEMYMPPPPSDPEPPLPPPPSPPPDYDSILFPTPPPSIRGDHDLPPPPTPPPPCDPAKTELDHLPPPPTPPPPPLVPATAELDLLPPPPTEQELDVLPLPSITPSKPTKMTVKPIKVPMLCKVPKLEPAISFEKMDGQAAQETRCRKNVTTSSASCTVLSSEIQSAFTKQPPESPRPPKKVFAPLTLTPPASPPPPCKSPVSKFKTPLIKAEQKYRQQREESCTPPPPCTPAFEIRMHESVSAALEMLSSESTGTVQSEASISFDFTQERAQKSVTKSESAADSYDSSKHTALSNAPPSKALIAAANEKSLPESPVISSVKQSIISNQSSQGSSGQQQTTSTSTKKKKKRSMTTNIQQVTRTVIKNTTQEEIKASVKTDEPQSVSKSVSETVGKDVSSISLSEDKTKEESSPKKNQEKNSPDRSKPNKESQIKDAEQKPQKVDSQKAKKVSKSTKLESKEKTTAEPENVQVKESTERSPTETEGEVEKEAKVKPVEEPPATPKKKRRSKNKKDRETAQGNNAASHSPTEATPAEPKWPVLTSDKKQEEITVEQTQQSIQTGHTEVYKEVIKTESTVQQQSFQEEGMTVKFQKQAGGSQQIPEESKDESRNVPIKMTGKSAQKEPAESLAESGSTYLSQTEALKMLSHISELQGVEGKIDSKSVKTLLNEMPAWLLGPEEKSDLEGAAAEHNEQKLKEILTHVKNLVQAKLMHFDGTIEKHECEATSEKLVSSGATQRISKISIGSTKCKTQKVVKEETKTTRKSRKQQLSSVTTLDPRAPSPLLRMRSPSPTFITIESTRRTDSPQRATPSPSPMPPTPPPRRSETPSSRLSRATPSPSSSRADSLTRLRNATATLSRGASPDPVPHVIAVTGKKSEIVESPATFHRQIKIDSKSTEEKRVKKTFETALVTAEVINANVNGDAVNILERLGPNTEDTKSESAVKEKENFSKMDLFGIAKTIESSEEKVGIRKDQADKTEKPGRETEDLELDTEKKARQQEDIPAFNIKDIKNVFEMSEQSSPIKALQNKQEEQESRVSEIASEGSKPELPPEREQCSQLSSPPPVCKDVKVDESVNPTGFSETKAVTEHYSSVDEFGTKIIGSRSTTTVSKHTQSVTTQRVPFSYADAVKKKTSEVKVSPEASAEELMKNFQKTWAESESVFKSLGVTDSSTKVRDVCSVQEEGLPHGRPDSRQKEVP
ncbi:xin actin-binding repeat-containing protein 2 [Megalobrama amblycephala]|uniref:xin actin-binding repeat-containing protein 2 n=1 Tax=Megalobrama amblycephala TaxID=75352 RepID=UPI002013E7D6|nr:xin actin-binding repeat-containing protein 2 [Megalobrama amblycephala]XP_048050605.1 xin actin-binding repeat-containing protein 2 [Megalobrama amblycephala]